MKQVIKKLPIYFMAILFMMESCSKSNVASPQQAVLDPGITVTSGSWTVSSLTQRGEAKTSSFNGYTFTFLGGGVLNAELKGNIVIGSWSFHPSAVVYYGTTPSKSSFTLTIGTTTPLNLLNKTWNVDSTGTNSTKLVLVSPEVAEGEQLIFTRN